MAAQSDKAPLVTPQGNMECISNKANVKAVFTLAVHRHRATESQQSLITTLKEEMSDRFRVSGTELCFFICSTI